MTPPFDAVTAVLRDYFEGLYRSDTAILSRVFHPKALYATATDGDLLVRSMPEYFPIVDVRPSPMSRGEARADEIISIEFIGENTALARVKCAIAPKYFIDILSLVYVDGRWQIISKVFHFETRPV